MASKFLAVYRRNATHDIERALPPFLAASGDGDVALSICKYFRQRGIHALFQTGRPDDLIRDLHYSARTYVFHLQAAGETQKVASKSAPFFDALASRDRVAAEAIARLGKKSWTEGEEFEDDYCYFRFLWAKFFPGAAPADLDAVLAKYEEILAGDYDPRFVLCRAMAAGDAAAFEAGLADLLLDHEARYKNLVEQDLVLPEEFASEGRLCVEGLALINAMESLGLSTRQDYLFIPSTSREPVSINYESERWRVTGATV